MEAESTAGYFLSPQQSHQWLLQPRSETRGSAQIAVLLEGEVDESRLRDALRRVVARHEILRSVFRRQAGMKTPFQVIQEASEPVWEANLEPVSGSNTEDEEAESLLRSQAALKFDYELGPMTRALLTRISASKYIFIVTIPTVCADTSSLRTLVRELLAYYTDPLYAPIEEPLRYIQFAQWQSELLESDDSGAVEGRAFWQQLAESGEQHIELPGEIKSESVGGKERVVAPVSSALLAQIKGLASGMDSSINDVMLSGWFSVLSRLTGRLRLAIGVDMPGREYEELGNAIGLIAKMLPIHARMEGDLRFKEVVSQIHGAIEKAVEQQEYLDPAKAFKSDESVAFSYFVEPESQQTGGLRYRLLSERDGTESAKLELRCIERGGNLKLEFYYDTSRYQSQTVERFARYYMTLLEAGVENPDQNVSLLPLLSQSERAQYLFDWNRTESPYPKQTMTALIEQQAERTPDRAAVRCQDQMLTYGELNRRSNQLAHYLRKLGVGPDSLVGLYLERSAETMIAVVAILKAGGAYVALSTDSPRQRLAQQLEGVLVLITERRLLELLPEKFGTKPVGPVLCLDTDAQVWAHEPETNPEAQATPENLAYVIFTSGSTGVPKGVGVRHRNLMNYAWAIAKQLNLADYPEGLQFATVSTLSADLGNTCIYPALLSGGGLHIIPYEVATDSRQFSLYLDRYPIDVLKIVPSHLSALLHSAEGGKVLPRRFLITGGETLTPNLIEKIEATGAGCQIINHYGPTETTVGSLIQPLSSYDWTRSGLASIPIGRPIANTQVYVLDAHSQVVPEGVAGELFISGAGVSAGYLGQPELTAERFFPNPFEPGTTMYRTGDLVRQIPGEVGRIEFLGRTDDQVKVRGFRIELGEIEVALARQPGVKQAVVLAREDKVRRDKQLVGYVVVSPGANLTESYIRQQLREQLPDYMVPAAVVRLEKLPLTANGKIDRKALPAPEEVAAPKAHVEPATPTAQAIALIWADVLQRKEISADDNFFELGGHSLTATQVVSRMREHFSVEIALRSIFETPVLKALADSLDAAKTNAMADAGPIRRISRENYRTGTPGAVAKVD